MPSSYRVTISGVTAAAPSDGFIDAKRLELYMASNQPASSYAKAQAKERANLRFTFLQQQLQSEANVYVENIDAAGATGDDAPSSFVFTAVVERGDDVLTTRDEANAGQVLTGIACLRRWVARALVAQRTLTGTIYDPTLRTTPGNPTAAPRYGVRIESIVVGRLADTLTTAEGLVGISKLP